MILEEKCWFPGNSFAKIPYFW